MRTLRDNLMGMLAQMKMEQSTFTSHWRDLADFIVPRRIRLERTDVNRGDKRNRNIVNPHATMAARTTRSGMMAGITSPARPWFKLGTGDKDLNEHGPVKVWLDTVRRRMATVFTRSNLYNSLPTVYGDQSIFATACMCIVEDPITIIRTYAYPIGSYYIGANGRLQVDSFAREYRMTVRQVVEKFGQVKSKSGSPDWSNISKTTKDQWDNGNHEAWVDVDHFIMPNPKGTPFGLRENKPYGSFYIEHGANQDIYLRKAGFEEFPVLAPRWEVAGEDVYGTECPGMIALGDIRGLQLKEKRKAEGIEKMVRPPMVGPTSLMTTKASILPGDITYADVRDGQQGFKAAHEVRMPLGELKDDIKETEHRISRAFFEDLFLMLAMSDRREITAREVAERHEEKLLALGPVLERENDELLDPLIDRTFAIMLRRGLIPRPPEELHDMPLEVEYISIMAQAQKIVGLAAVERFAGFVGNLAAVSPEVMDKLDVDQTVDEYADMTGVPPSIVRTDDAVAEIRETRRKAQEAAVASEQMAAASQSAKVLSEADTGGRNALTDLLGAAA